MDVQLHHNFRFFSMYEKVVGLAILILKKLEMNPPWFLNQPLEKYKPNLITL